MASGPKKDRRGRKFTAAQKAQIKEMFVEAVKQTSGVITEACDMVVIDGSPIGRDAILRWRNEDPEFSKAIEDCVEIGLDRAESKLHELIEAGDIRAIIFYLKCKGKRRGYIEQEPRVLITGEQQMVAPQIILTNERDIDDDTEG